MCAAVHSQDIAPSASSITKQAGQCEALSTSTLHMVNSKAQFDFCLAQGTEVVQTGEREAETSWALYSSLQGGNQVEVNVFPPVTSDRTRGNCPNLHQLA